MQAERLTWDNLLPVCSPNYLQSSAALITPNDLVNHTLLHVIGYEEGWGHWLKQTNHEHLKISHEFQFDTLVTALEMASLGEGIALGRSSLVDNMLISGKLVAPFKEEISTDEAFHLVYASSNLVHPHANKFKDWLLSKIEPK